MHDLNSNLKFLLTYEMRQWPKEARTWIRAGLADANRENRLMAVSAASGIVDDEIADSLLQLMRSDMDEKVVATAAISLGPALELYEEEMDFNDGPDNVDINTVSSEKCREIMRALESLYRGEDRSKLVRRRCLEAAARGPLTWQPQAVRECAKSEDSEWLTTAMFCMGYIAGFDEEILAALDSDDEDVKREALRAAGRQNLQTAGKTLAAVASDPNAAKPLRLAAIEALGTVAHLNSLDLLNELYEDEDDEIAEMAEYALDERMIFGPDGVAGSVD